MISMRSIICNFFLLLIAPSGVSEISGYAPGDGDSSSLLVIWQAPSGQCQTDTYTVRYALRNRDMCQEVNQEAVMYDGDVTVAQVQINELESFSEYTIFVTPRNSAGVGPEEQGSAHTGQQGTRVSHVTMHTDN